MSYKEVKQKYPFSTIKAIKKDQVEKYLKMGYTLVSDFIIDNWGLDFEHCYMVY